ncbi:MULTISPECIES: carbohydrate ABC transporter permease [Paenibacillus]|uniref:Multiple sugar transport system permease protein n=1 Tax=Paenibacillus barengoltzii J12 TaxID=935846 RepID=A0ABY1LVR2_9BACL|nr:MULTISPECIES: carbohydrate ABC transporter permease [Paenibacillus]MEC2345801.1 carbohydrate ABC transporter permease [Paenibacillus barengoltzii]SMF14810.1 multiple sugar transport system permease protein [Paenibacillus barengoltzii J12]
MQAIQWIQKAVLTGMLGLFAVLLLFPVIITFTNSLMSEQELEINYGPMGELTEAASTEADTFINLKWVPDQVTLAQYGRLLVYTPNYLLMFWRSVELVLPIIVGQTAVAAMAAYALSKLRFRGRDAIFLIFLLSMLMPFQVTLVPNYLMADWLGLIHRPTAVILPGIFAAFGVFMLRQFMLHIPYAYIEAAKIDGAGHLRIFLTIILPMVKPGLAALVVLLFVDYWNMVEQPLIFLDPLRQPLSVFLSRLSGEWGTVFAASMLYMSPMVLLFLYAEAYFIEGVQLSGIKG